MTQDNERVSLFMGMQSTLSVSRAFLHNCETITDAVVLAQLYEWTKEMKYHPTIQHEGYVWIARTIEDIAELTAIEPQTVKRSLTKLSNLGAIVRSVYRKDLIPVSLHRVNEELIAAWFIDYAKASEARPHA